jgi:hypothetical protein
MTRSRREYDEARNLLLEGHNPGETSRVTGIPRSTIRDWHRGMRASTVRGPSVDGENCSCRERRVASRSAEYSYLLGLYLGDGCISAGRRGVWRLRITLDTRYPGIIEDCARAMEALMPGQDAYRLPRKGCIEVSMCSKHWTCLFPQHGSGRKHARLIELRPWQEALVQDWPEQFLRGLIHSDGCRIVALDRGRPSVRYLFSNLSEDIKNLFCGTLDRLSIRWTRPLDKNDRRLSKGRGPAPRPVHRPKALMSRKFSPGPSQLARRWMHCRLR